MIYSILGVKARIGGIKMTDEIKQQIIAISRTGLTNMFDIDRVIVIAQELNFMELIEYIEQDKNRYFNFILRGREWG